MVTYEQAKNLAIFNTIPDGKVYYAGDAGDFYIFTIVNKNINTDVKGLITGTSFMAIDKKDGRVWTVNINDKRLQNVKKIKGPTKDLIKK